MKTKPHDPVAWDEAWDEEFKPFSLTAQSRFLIVCGLLILVMLLAGFDARIFVEWMMQ